ncbi:MAG TPA: MBL fold metallo-hydrolase [Chloroflexota bacterium]|nr:MBL fold metallo-hydrolase [Chloroflexota bacterium]
MTTITVLAGARTIGGTQVVVEEHGARLLFDCGIAYDPAGNPFAQVQRRRGRVLSDLLTLGLAPFMPGLYAPEFMPDPAASPPAALPPSDGPLAVALSHSHLDHTHLMGFVDPAVPVYASDAAARIVPVLADLGYSLGPLRNQPLQALAPDEPLAVGSLRAHLLPVDHDVCGARGMLIETGDGVIAYSGDLRLHGSHPDYTHTFAQAVRAAGARLLIIEGTRLRPPAEAAPDSAPQEERRERSEAEVAPAVAEALLQAPDQLGIILLTPENGERVETLARAMAAIGRTLVLDPDALAFVVAALGRPIAGEFAVYLPGPLAAARARGEALPASIERAIAAAPRLLTAQEIAANPDRFLLRLNFADFADLIDLLPKPGGLLFLANGTPLGPFDPAWPQMEWWARRHGMSTVDVASTGHARPEDLTAIALESGAPTVMVIHSVYPELFAAPGARILLPEQGRRYELAALAP